MKNSRFAPGGRLTLKPDWVKVEILATHPSSDLSAFTITCLGDFPPAGVSTGFQTYTMKLLVFSVLYLFFDTNVTTHAKLKRVFFEITSKTCN